MKLLLDTHIWLWLTLEPHKLHARVSAAIEDQANELWLSPISVWEALVHVEKRRLMVDEPFADWLQLLVRRAPCREAALTNEIILELTRFSLSQSDPADRFLVATARVNGLTLVTSDKRVLKGRACNLLSNR